MKMGIYGNRCFIPYKYANGGRWANMNKTDYRSQIFSFQALPNGELYHFDIRRLEVLIEKADPPFDCVVSIEYVVTRQQAAYITRVAGIEKEGVLRIGGSRLDQPGIICDFPDGSVIVDGNHRFVRRYLDGHEFMEFYSLTEEQYRLALLDVPDELGKKMIPGYVEIQK